MALVVLWGLEASAPVGGNLIRLLLAVLAVVFVIQPAEGRRIID